MSIEQRSRPEPGWLCAEALVRDDGPLDEIVHAIARRAGIDHPPLGAEWLLEHHARPGASLTAAAMMSGWVPDLVPGNVLLHFRDGAVWGIALRGGRVRPEPDEPAPARAGHDMLVAHLTPVIDALAARRMRARRALWRAAGDRAAPAFMWCAEAFSDADRAFPAPSCAPDARSAGRDAPERRPDSASTTTGPFSVLNASVC